MANEILKSLTISGVTFDVPQGGGGGGTYRLNKSGSNIQLTEDGTVVSTVTDDDTKYTFSMSGNTLTITPSSGTAQTVTIPNDNTTYTLSISGNTLTLTPSTGSPQSVTVPGTTYTLTKSGDTITLTGSDGSTTSVTDKDTWQANTDTQDGYVTASGSHPNCVWRTNADGEPAWVPDAGGLTKDAVLTAMGYREIDITMKDTTGAIGTWRVMGAKIDGTEPTPIDVGEVTKARILIAMGYREFSMNMRDTDGTISTWNIIGKKLV